MLEFGLLVGLLWTGMAGFAALGVARYLWRSLSGPRAGALLPGRGAPMSRGVPARWNWSPSQVATMHRRLQLSVASATHAWERLESAGTESAAIEGRGIRPDSSRRMRRAWRQRAEDPWEEPLRTLVRLAFEVDGALVRAQRAALPLRAALAVQVEPQVAEVELLASRYVASVEGRLERAGHSVLGRMVAERLDALDEASERLGGPDLLPGA